MGYARIISGGTDGRYLIEEDTGEAFRIGLMNALLQKYTQILIKLEQVQARVNTADATEATARESIIVFVGYMVAFQQSLPEGTSANAESMNGPNSIYTQLLKNYIKLQEQSLPDRRALATLKALKTETARKRTEIENLIALRQRQVWCCDLTEDAAPGAYVATVDIPGEADLRLIAPGAPTPVTATDGAFLERPLMSPEQAFFNAAILPGWQKYKPTYRWGTLTDIDAAANTGDVTLFDSTSSAQRLEVNQTSSLAAVPFEYMGCHNVAFQVGDEVVVKFAGQDWSAPSIIGFLDNPRPCDLMCIGVQVTTHYTFFTASYSDSQSILTDIRNGLATLECRMNRGAWHNMPPIDDIGASYQFFGLVPAIDDAPFTCILVVYLDPTSAGAFPPLPLGTLAALSMHGSDRVVVHPTIPAIFEIRINLAGVLVFNAACEDLANDNFSSMGVRNKHGISNTWSIPVHLLTGYQLFHETGN